jgi:hypothetical protein
MWVLYNYVTRLGIYLVLRVVSGGNVSLDRIAPAMAKAAGISPASVRRIWKSHELFRSSVETHGIAKKHLPF